MAEISLVVAMSRNGVIGRDGGLPWRLPTDMARFKALTMGKPVIMGRKTWETLRKPLPGRANIVITRNPAWRAEGADVTGSLEDGLKLAAVRARCSGVGEEICVIGGGEIYTQAMEYADVLQVTFVEAEIEGDTRFPTIDPAIWEAFERISVDKGERDDMAMEFVTFRRRR